MSSLAFAGAAEAAGVGRLTVFSALGQPLRAEIAVTATREELTDMKVRLATPDAFKQAGLDYATALLSLRFNLEKQANGQSVIKVSSDRPINDPFLDMLLELNWSSGRLVREFTVLLDPPEYAAKTAAAAATAPVVASRPLPPQAAIRPGGVAPSAGTSRIDSDVRARAAAQVGAARPAAVAAVPARAPEPAPVGGEQHEVKRGETLHRIAANLKPEGVSLDQMLVGLFQANPGAFEGGNMNRLRSGAILTVPDRTTVQAVDAGEARKAVVAQSANWNSYRNKLAAVAAKAPTREEGATQEAGGRITAKVEDKAAPAGPKDEVKVSRADAGAAGKGGAAAAASGDDLAARDRALKDANERVAALEKNVADLQKLLDLKNQSLAELQKQATSGPAATVAPKTETPPPASAPVEAPKPEAAVAQAPAESAPPAQAETAAPAPKPAPKPAAKPKTPPPPPPPPEPPSFFEELLGNTTMLAGLGGILALLVAFLFVRRKKAAAAEAAETEAGSTLTPPLASGLTSNSVFRSTGGQAVDTSSQRLQQTDFSQAGPGSIDTDEVDPVAEADVYMAYGRDAQAEEILLEARQKDPKRVAIAAKLLEIYSGRKDVAQFEALATEIYGETGGVGADWDKIAAMGRTLDPNNPIFRGMVTGGAKTETVASPLVQAPSFDALPAAVAAAAATSAAAAAASDSPAPAAPVAFDLDFDLDAPSAGSEKPSVSAEAVSTPASSAAAPAAAPVGLSSGAAALGAAGLAAASGVLAQNPNDLIKTSVRGELPDLDFDIGTKIAPDEMLPAHGMDSPAAADLDFDLGDADLGSAASAATSSSAGEAPLGSDAVEFDVNLTESTFLGRSMVASPFEMSAIDLNLDVPEIGGESTVIQPADATATNIAAVDQSPEIAQVATAINPESIDQSETLIASPAFEQAQRDTVVNPDFVQDQVETLLAPAAPGEAHDGVSTAFVASGQETLLVPDESSVSETVVNPGNAVDQAETVLAPSLGLAGDSGLEFDAPGNEEVATKLDLAKAYEEMGDVEGARELLQEVLNEGTAGQREAAQSALVRLGG